VLLEARNSAPFRLCRVSSPAQRGGADPLGRLQCVTRASGTPEAVRYEYSYDPTFLDQVTEIMASSPATGQRSPHSQGWRYDYYAPMGELPTCVPSATVCGIRLSCEQVGDLSTSAVEELHGCGDCCRSPDNMG
jgi:hypothetical protein